MNSCSSSMSLHCSFIAWNRTKPSHRVLKSDNVILLNSPKISDWLRLQQTDCCTVTCFFPVLLHYFLPQWVSDSFLILQRPVLFSHYFSCAWISQCFLRLNRIWSNLSFYSKPKYSLPINDTHVGKHRTTTSLSLLIYLSMFWHSQCYVRQFRGIEKYVVLGFSVVILPTCLCQD